MTYLNLKGLDSILSGASYIKGNKLEYVQKRMRRMEQGLETMSLSHSQHELSAYCVPYTGLSTGYTEINKAQPFDFKE